MKAKRILLSTLVIGVVLFLYSGLSQSFPWGVPTAQVVSCATETPELFMSGAKVREFPPGKLTTPEFDDVFLGKISTLTTDKSFSWIVTTDIGAYKPANYLMREALNQFLVAFFLSVILALTVDFNNRKRLILILVVALAGIAATYIPQLNWWSVPASYELGMALNILISWFASVFISATWILRPENKTNGK